MPPKPWCHSCEGNDTGTRSPGHRCAGEPLCLKDPSVPLQACPPVRGMGDSVHRFDDFVHFVLSIIRRWQPEQVKVQEPPRYVCLQDLTSLPTAATQLSQGKSHGLIYNVPIHPPLDFFPLIISLLCQGSTKECPVHWNNCTRPRDQCIPGILNPWGQSPPVLAKGERLWGSSG